MKREKRVAEALADAVLAGSRDAVSCAERAAYVLGRKHRWIAPLCRRLFDTFGSFLEERDRIRLVEWIRADRGYRAAWQSARAPRIVRYGLEPPRMSSRQGALAACDLPDLPTARDLADWLGLSPNELDWYADYRGMNGARDPLCHYRYRWIPKSYGMRLMEAPKPRLRELQRRILRGILDRVPAHFAAHAFRQGRSCRTFAEPHVGRAIVLRMDLRDFFPGIASSRIHALFGMLGYPTGVARLLTALCTNAVPMPVARMGAGSWQAAKQLGLPHLPQGAPTSPALANLCALHLDLRLDELARTLAGQYTRYADDLAISGDETLRRHVGAVTSLVAKIAVEEGFSVNHRKSRAMHRCERQVLTGVVVNERLNVRRDDYDRLKAVLTNCVRHGPASQNRDGVRDYAAQLAGRVAHVASLNPARGTKLRQLFDRIEWPR